VSVPFEAVAIANRGEIALRIARTLRRLGIRSVLLAHPLDATSPAATAVDEVVPLEGEPVAAYLDAAGIVEAAAKAGAQAIHPGYGFLAENATFAELVGEGGMSFVGPSPAVIRLMGDKIASRAFAAQHGFRISASAQEEDDPGSFAERAEAVGFPLLVKASAGGGGKGMHIVRGAEELEDAVLLARSEAERYFGDGRLYAERYVEEPRHIEVQVLADRHGTCLHLFERECSIQRRFQKLIEECPAPRLEPGVRDAMHREAVGIAAAAGYEGAGTVEFILGRDAAFSFLEMNTRLQVEHPVTEAVTGIDLVEQQLRVAAGEPLALSQDEVRIDGHAIECRICAEVPEEGYRPATGTLRLVREAAGPGVRLDSGVQQGSRVSAAFDPMLAKLIVHGPSRDETIVRLRAALAATVLLGVRTNTNFLGDVVDHPAFRAGALHTGFLEAHSAELAHDDEASERLAVALAAATNRAFMDPVRAVPALHAAIGGWRN